MKRLLAVMVVAIAVTSCTSRNSSKTGTGTPSTSGQGFAAAADAQNAAQIADFYSKNDWKSMRARFDSNMASKLSEAGLGDSWKQVLQLKGDFKSRGEPAQVAKQGELTVFDTPMHFARGDMKNRVALRANGQIAGLFILVYDRP